MKKTLLIIILILPIIFFLNFKNNTKINSEANNINILGEEVSDTENIININYQNNIYRIKWVEVSNPEDLVLIPNFSERKTANEIKNNYKCNIITNAGFYASGDISSEDNLPIGLFITDENEINKFTSNKLFNGIFSINILNTPRITSSVPGDLLKIAVQTGPILIENSFAKKLTLNRDKEARRVVAAVTGENKIILIIIYNSNSVFNGPLLSDLPSILDMFREETKINIADAINLDGGSASAFITEDFSLTEISPVGSFFCVR